MTETIFTYEVGTDEVIHPDPEIRGRFIEVALSDCRYGCKIYADPRSGVRVLAHNSTYGCPKAHVWVRESKYNRIDL